MNELIPVFSGQIANQPAQLVDARVLHGFLDSKRNFANWISERIKSYGFQLNLDYLEVFNKSVKNPDTFASPNSEAKTDKGGRPTIDYHLTLDMAKELAMVERNDKGREARRYFIDCERRLYQAAQPKKPVWPRSLRQDPETERKHYDELQKAFLKAFPKERRPNMPPRPVTITPGYDTLDAFIETRKQAVSYLHLIQAGINHAKQETQVLDALEDITAIVIDYHDRLIHQEATLN